MTLLIEGALMPAGALRLHPGTITVLLGANGVGKTRLMETIAGLRKPEGLTITYGTEPLWIVRDKQPRGGKLHRNEKAMLAYSYSCQSPEEQLFARSVRDELRYVLRPYQLDETECERRSVEALSAVGWDASWLDRDPYLMSGGERRRTALASLFATPAAWLLLDEPTAGLDAAGHERLGQQLKRHAANGKGVLLISHESDWALQLADAALILRVDGSMQRSSREELLERPSQLEEAGMEIPAWLRVAHRLIRLGVPPEQIWQPAAHRAMVANQVDVVQSSPPRVPQAGRTPFMQRNADKPISPLTGFDPRSVWLSYILFSAAILTQSTWIGLGAMAILVALSIYLGKIPLRRWRGAIMALSVFTVTVALIAGLGPQEQGGFWSAADAVASLQSLLRPLLAMLLGFGLPLAVTPLRLRRSLEQLFAMFGRLPRWGTKLILTVTLLLRFIPVLLTEWERFARIGIARGKRIKRSPGGGFKRLQETAIPFMLALFRLGEQVSDALESRGVSVERQPTVLVTERWKRRDTLLTAASASILVIFWLWQ
ncbi:ATP-binding cassette domain-containing protein [Paenibacillus silvisoli]|uniref:ATP-binding cassette domain-containing protein n=1 Tax=Paenibacillus silvisoli TaxID=3110539 RepID=UPI002806560C|nr:ATP-binding cassette domain-containing protein [Paenibacillus silvisoli]